VFDLDGNFRGYRGTGRDVTREVVARDAARRAERRLIEAMDAAPCAVALVDSHLQLVSGNSALRSMAAAKGEPLPFGKPFSGFLAGLKADAVSPEILRALAETGEMREMAFGGSWYLAAAGRLSDGGMVLTLSDVTALKERERELAESKLSAESANQLKSQFLATMSHELRTPLNAIIGFSDMIVQEDALMLDAVRRKEYAQLINDSGQHLLSVVNGILDMSKMESGNFEISPEPFAPRAALLNCCNLLALKARESIIDLVTRAPEDLPVMTGDPRAFKQIVLNLVSNAIKFTERGGKVTVSAGVEGSRLMLRVTDTGVGIAADDLKRVGDPFFQAGKTYQRRHEGTGLGLSIVKSLIGLHAGEITVQSKIDEGTTVTVALPLAFTPPAAKPSSNIATLTPGLRSATQDQAHQVKKSA
jgi:cell cycle sensor histidine kinase DivJ